MYARLEPLRLCRESGSSPRQIWTDLPSLKGRCIECTRLMVPFDHTLDHVIHVRTGGVGLLCAIWRCTRFHHLLGPFAMQRRAESVPVRWFAIQRRTGVSVARQLIRNLPSYVDLRKAGIRGLH